MVERQGRNGKERRRHEVRDSVKQVDHVNRFSSLWSARRNKVLETNQTISVSAPVRGSSEVPPSSVIRPHHTLLLHTWWVSKECVFDGREAHPCLMCSRVVFVFLSLFNCSEAEATARRRWDVRRQPVLTLGVNLGVAKSPSLARPQRHLGRAATWLEVAIVHGQEIVSVTPTPCQVTCSNYGSCLPRLLGQVGQSQWLSDGRQT